MASEQRGPTPTRLLEPPGFLALHYGRRTPVIVLAGHAVYGAILGGFYGFTHVGLINAALTIAECEGLDSQADERELEHAPSPGAPRRSLPGEEAEVR